MGDEARNVCRGPPPCSLRNLKSVIPKKGEVPVKGTNFFGRRPRQKPPKTTATFPSPVPSSMVPGFRERPATPAQECRSGTPARECRQERRSGPPPGSVRHPKPGIPKKNCAVPVKGTKFPGRQPCPQPPPPSRTSPMTESGFGRCAAPPSRTILGFWEEFWTFGREIPEKLTIFLKKRKIFRI